MGIELYADGLNSIMLLMTTVVGTAACAYTVAYFGHRKGNNTEAVADHAAAREHFWPLYLFLWAALNALFLGADAFNLYVTLELVTLASVGLVALAGTAVALTAALRYLLWAVTGSLFYLLGVALLYAVHATLDLASLGGLLGPGPVTWCAMALMTVGLMIKAALFPVHGWLPPAHANAPAPVSAVLSALIVKAPLYILLRLWTQVFPGAVTPGAGQLLGVLGAAAILWGSFQAFRTPRLKLLVAYSTVAQIGYVFVFFPLARNEGIAAAWNGVVVFLVAHACAKAGLFLAAGTLLHAAGHDQLDKLHGLGQRFPMTVLTIAVAGVNLMGLPPSGGFAAKWLMLTAAVRTGQWWWAAVLIAGGLLAATYLFRILRLALVASSAGAVAGGRPPRSLDVPALALALLAFLMGFATDPLLQLLQIGSPFAAGSNPEATP